MGSAWLVALIVAGGISVFVYRQLTAPDVTHVSGLAAIPTHNAVPIPSITLVTPPPAPKVVRIRWGPTDLLPAQAAGHICVNAEETLEGQFCAAYTAGERPADALTREIQRHGDRVERSGLD